MIKNISLILNSILLVAVIVLYVLFFAGRKSKTTNYNNENNEQAQINTQGEIVFINIDSVLNNYKMYVDIQEELQAKLKASEDQLANQDKNLRKEVEDFQYKVGKQLVTRSEADEIQQTLARKEQELYQLQSNLQKKLGEEQQVALNKVLNSIMGYLESIESEKKYKFVLGTTFGGNIFYANKKLNISNEVVKGLNEKYSADIEKK
jgi:outer membrane protein